MVGVDDQISFFDIAARRARLTPERSALFFEGNSYSYFDLDQRAAATAAFLSARGLAAGARVSILARNHLAHIDLILATAKLGVIYTPLNYRLPAEELKVLIDYVRPQFLIVEEALSELAPNGLVDCVELAQMQSEITQRHSESIELGLKSEDVAMMLFTGGTTGQPKAAMLPWRQLHANAINTIFSWGLSERDSVIQVTPAFHAGINALAMPLLYAGGRVVLLREFDAGGYLQAVRDHRPTLMFMVPTMYRMLVEHPDFEATDFSCVRWAISGGAPCPEDLIRTWAQRGVPFRQGYGMTEAGVNCFSMTSEEAQAYPHSVGRPMLWADAVIRDENGLDLPVDEVGELTLAGPHLALGYFERPDETKNTWRDGWLWTGDLAYRDANGFFTICGRHKEMFISGGENVYPAEVENALQNLPEVAECAVVGVSDERWGEVGLAAVVAACSSPLNADALREQLRGRIAAYKIPAHFVWMDALPQSAAGKIIKSDIVAHWAELQRVSAR